MNVSGLVVRARPERCSEVSVRLAAMPGVCVHAADKDGRMVVTVEDVPGGSAADTLVAVHGVAGVVAASLVYQYDDLTA